MLSSDFMKILKGTDYSFLRENEHLANKIMLLGLSGSYGYGTNREGSDVDFRGVAMQQPSDILGLTEFEQYSARLRRLQEEEKRRKEHEEYLQKQRIKALYNNEVDKTTALLNKTADFEIACRIRRYIDAIKNDPSNPDNNPDWIDRASKKADWIDPTVAREDEFFGKRKHGLDVDQKRLEKRWR